MGRPDERQRLEVALDRARVSPKRFNGWEPSWETVYEYDDAGRLVRSVTRQIEPEWDDDTRGLVEGLARYDADCCPGCGMHKSILDDFENHHFTFEERFCPACIDQATYGRVLAERDEEATPKDKQGAPAWDGPRARRPDDGRHVFVRQLTAAEVEERQQREEVRRGHNPSRGGRS